MSKKYELVNYNKETGLWQIRALRDFGGVEAGDLGGWISGEHNMSHNGNCWVADNAHVHGGAHVHGEARVYGTAWVYGNAQVYDDAQVYGKISVHYNMRIQHAHHDKPIQFFDLGRHTITVDGEYLNIWCESRTIKEWLEVAPVLGKKEGYNEEEIQRYVNCIQMIHDSVYKEENRMGFEPAPTSGSSRPKQSTPPQPKTDSDVNTKIPDKILKENIIICPRCNGTGIYIPDPALVEFNRSFRDPLPKEEHPCSRCGGSGRMLKIVLLRRLHEAEDF